MMRRNADVLGYRAKLGCIGPSTNTVVQPDYERLRPHGVTNHYSRIPIENPSAISDADFIATTNIIGANTLEAVKWVMTCKPDRLVMGMSAVTFYGGIKGAQEFQRRVEDCAGVEATIGSIALVEALRAYGNIRRVSFLSPYYPSANREVRAFLEESGFEVVHDLAMQRPGWLAIAETTEREVINALKRIDGDDVDALVQVGTNLSMLRIAAAAELWLDKPVIAINAATYWHALRALGIADPVYGYGRLMEEF